MSFTKEHRITGSEIVYFGIIPELVSSKKIAVLKDLFFLFIFKNRKTSNCEDIGIENILMVSKKGLYSPRWRDSYLISYVV